MRKRHVPSKLWLLLFVVSAVVVLLGCTRTWIGNGGGAKSPKATYSAGVWAWGGYGQAYYEFSNKEVHVTVRREPYSRNEILLEKKYKIPASDLRWNVQWVSDEEVVIELFDYGKDISSHDAKTTEVSRRKIVSLRFMRRPDANVFDEIEKVYP